MPVSTIVLVINAILLIVALIIAGILLQSGHKFSYYVGLWEITEPLKWRILKLLVLVIAIGLIASVFNIVWPLFAQ